MTEDVAPALAEAFRGRYAIERELGRGGMATVYLARDLKHDRLVAVKVLRPELAAVLGGERFLREIRLTAQLQHPRILSLLDSGEAAGFLYYVMPFVEGESLRDRLNREGQLPLESALGIARAVAGVLDYAHERGVIHRDIKPENILVYQGEPMVADFGVALAATSAGRERLTETGLSLGTPTYMSPEQASAAPRLDGRSDQYSLACVVYEMLAGEPPYTGPTAQAIIAKRLSEPVPRLGTLRKVPQTVEAAVIRALAKSPADRFSTIGAFATALEEPSSVKTHPERLALKLRIMGGLALVLATLAAVGWWQIGRPTPSESRDTATPKSIAVLPFTNLSRDPDNEYFSDGITEDIASQLARIRDLKVVAHTSALRFKGSQEPPHVIGEALGVGTLLQGSVRRSGDRVRVAARLVDAHSGEQIWADEYDRELRDVFAIQRDVAERIAASLRASLSPQERARLQHRPSADPEAYNLYLLGLHAFLRYTPPAWQQSIGYFEQAIARDSTFANAYAVLADAHVLLAQMGRTRPADAIPRARAAALRALALDSTLGDAYASLGLVAAVYDRKWDVAETQFRRALALNPSSAYAHTLYAAFVLSPLGRHDEAIAEMRQAEDLDPVSLPVRFNVGLRYYFARRYNEAIAEFKRMLELDSTFGSAHMGLGFSYAALGRFDDAIEELRRANNDSTVTSDAVVGYVYALAGRRQEARAVLREVEQRSARGYVVPLDFSIIYAALGERDQAFRWLRRAYDEHSPLLVWINVAAWYDTVRDDPRFTALVRDLGLQRS